MSLTLSDRDVLQAWSGSRGRGSDERAAALLARALPPDQRASLSSWPLARRNAALLELRIARWGTRLQASASCPECGEELELSLELDAIGIQADACAADLEVETDAGTIRFRLPNELDLQAVAAHEDPAAARRALAERCLVARGSGPLGEEAIAAISGRMARADPAGALDLDFHCPECDGRWSECPDLASFVADEASAEARRIAAEVHALACAYGWSEDDILALPAERRRLYLELVDR